MPAPFTTTALLFGLCLTQVSAVAGCIVAGGGCLWEGYLFYRSGTDVG